ncbi:MAG: GntR family transcriptional regulator [Rhodobacteraceae bacterium]|nr:GntR family transcriptional regulator [Paracoccaceae bacterium]
MTTKPSNSWTDIRDIIHARILNKTYAAGDRLPRDQDLALTLGCARSTVQRAMQDLSDRGLIERRRKAGTRIPENPVTRATLEIPMIRKEVEQKGVTHGYQLISAKMLETPRSVMALLGLPAPITAMHVQALHLADQQPYLFEDRWINTQTVPEATSIDFTRENANEWLLRHKPYNKCDMRFYAINASISEADLLQTSPGTALFVMERSTWIDQNPITTVKTIAAPGYQLKTGS